MLPISIDDKGWYARAVAELTAKREVDILILGKAARALRYDLKMAGDGSQRGGWLNLWFMLRHGRFYRLVARALALGLGVSMEDTQEKQLLVKVNSRIGCERLSAGVFVVYKARCSENTQV